PETVPQSGGNRPLYLANGRVPDSLLSCHPAPRTTILGLVWCDIKSDRGVDLASDYRSVPLGPCTSIPHQGSGRVVWIGLRAASVRFMGIRDRPIAPRSPWQNACVRDSLARSAGSAWTTSSCSVKRTCAGSQAPMLPTIMSRGPIDPWTRTPRSIAPFSASAPSHHSLPSAYFITNIAESNFRYTQEAAAHSLGQQLIVLHASSERDLDVASATLAQQRADALIVFGAAFFLSRRDQIIALAAQHGLPAIYPVPDFVAAGGLMTYGASIRDAYRL